MKKIVSLASLVIVLVSALSVRAQLVPRTVLLEEGTNWSCPPCAALNPSLEAWLQTKGDSVIQIAYHPNWPGNNDPMYLNDVKNNQGRVVNYYGIGGVPQVEIDGGAASSSVISFEQAYQSRLAKLSPVSLSVTRSQVGTSVTINVTVTAVGDVSAYSNLVLRVAAVERFVDTTGPNGEKRYMNPMRAMMPDLNGTSLNLKAGAPQKFTFSYDIADSYRPEKMYEVAFVQNDDNSKEVLQAASTLESFGVSAKQPEKPIQVLSSSTGNLDMQVSNTTPEDLTFSCAYLPLTGKDWTVTLNGQGTTTMPLKTGEVGTMQLGVTQGTSAYTSGMVIVSAITGRGDTVVTPYPVKFVSPSTRLAFVDVSGDSTKSVATLKTLTAMNLRFVPLTDLEMANLKGWNATTFPQVILEANKWIITGANKAGIAGYLTSGGKLLAHGGEIAYGLADTGSTPADRDSAFLETVLHADYVQDVASSKTIHGVTSDPITNAFATTNINIFASNIDNPIQPDVIRAINGATPIFYYGTGTSDVAGLRWEGEGAKLAYLAFGLQNLPTTSRQQIISSILTWFGPLSSTATSTMPVFALGACYPNPISSSTLIPYSLQSAGAVRLTIVDVRGNEVAVVADGFESSGDHTATFDVHNLAHGTYFCVIHAAEGSAMRALSVE